VIHVSVLAADPGQATGLAWRIAEGDGGLVTVVAPSAEAVYRLVHHLAPQVIVVEWFVTGQRLNQYSRYTIEICGGLEALSIVLGARLVKHTPKSREGMMDRAEDLLIAHWGERGSKAHSGGKWTSHQQDALSHLLAYEETGG
jgi:hypothetical protein